MVSSLHSSNEKMINVTRENELTTLDSSRLSPVESGHRCIKAIQLLYRNDTMSGTPDL